MNGRRKLNAGKIAGMVLVALFLLVLVSVPVLIVLIGRAGPVELSAAEQVFAAAGGEDLVVWGGRSYVIVGSAQGGQANLVLRPVFGGSSLSNSSQLVPLSLLAKDGAFVVKANDDARRLRLFNGWVRGLVPR